MKTGILVAAVAGVLGLGGLSGWLIYQNLQLDKQLKEKGQQLAKVQSEAERQIMARLAAAGSQLAEAKEEIARLNNEIQFPIEITCKKSTAGPSVQLLNTFTNLLPVTVTFSNAKLKKSRTLTIELGPGFSRELSRPEGWAVATGDVVQVGCSGYLPVTRAIE